MEGCAHWAGAAGTRCIMPGTMTVKRRGLGRGLDALLGPAAIGAAAQPTDSGPGRVPVDLIERSRFQPRGEINPESLVDLADSLRVQGLMQPAGVRPPRGRA